MDSFSFMTPLTPLSGCSLGLMPSASPTRFLLLHKERESRCCCCCLQLVLGWPAAAAAALPTRPPGTKSPTQKFRRTRARNSGNFTGRTRRGRVTRPPRVGHDSWAPEGALLNGYLRLVSSFSLVFLRRWALAPSLGDHGSPGL